MGLKFFEWWKRLSGWQRRVVLVGALAALVAVFEVVGLRPLRHRLARVRHDVQELERQLRQAVTLSRQARTIERAYEAYRPFVPSTEAASNLQDPVRAQSQVQSEIESEARAVGMNLLTVRPVTEAPTADQLGVAMEVEATPAQLIQWLDHVRRSTSLLGISRLVIRVGEEPSRVLRCSMIVTKLRLAISGT